MKVKMTELEKAIEEYKEIMEGPKMRKAIEEYKKIMGVTKSYINMPGADEFIEIRSESYESILEKEIQAYKKIIETISNIFPETADKNRNDCYRKAATLKHIFKDNDQTKKNFLNWTKLNP